MQRTEGLVSIAQPNDRNPWSAALAGSLAVFVVALAVVLALRAGWLDRVVTSLPGVGPGWLAAAIAAGVLLGGLSLLWLALSRFAREVESAPYVWLAPIMTALPSIALVAWELPAPHGLPVRLFAIVWVPLLIGGGSLLQAPGWGRKAIGFAMLALPAGWVLGSLTAAGAMNLARGFAQADQPTQLFAAVVTLTCIGVATLAALTREQGLRGEHLHYALLEERQLIAAERASLAAERAGLDELVERAERAMGGPSHHLDTQELALMQPPRRSVWPLALIPALVAGGLMAFEFGHRRPMRAMQSELSALKTTRAESEAALRANLATHHAEALEAVEVARDKAEGERDQLAEQLKALRGNAAAVTAAPPGEPKQQVVEASAPAQAPPEKKAPPKALIEPASRQAAVSPAARKRQNKQRLARRRAARRAKAQPARANAKARAMAAPSKPAKAPAEAKPDPLRGTAADASDDDPLSGLEL